MLVELGYCPLVILHFNGKEHISRDLPDKMPQEHLSFSRIGRKSSGYLNVLRLINFHLMSVDKEVGRAMVSLKRMILMNF